MNIRSFVRHASVIGAVALSGMALAVDNLKVMIPANPGGGWDSTGRALVAAMQSAGSVKNVQMDNKGGAAGTIGLAQFINTSKGDPNAIMIGGMVMVGGIIQNKSTVDLTMVTPLARLTEEYLVIVVPANSPHKSIKDLAAAFKANPGSVSWGGGSAGGTDHILAGFIAKASGIDASKVNYVPFKGGGEAVAAIIGGHVTAGISGVSEFAQHIQSGKMRALAVSSPTPQAGIPTLKDQGINVVLGNWRGVFGAPGITTAQRNELIKAIEAGVKSKSWEEALKKNEWMNTWQSGDEYKNYVDTEIKRIGEILAGLGLGKK
ncbi:MAG TPA: tripartite tricarboxylate transporter substrate-binding protein [Casimicrobium sp.]|jgi:putative tricarboxylic transport membrane protein|nr:tripartite tricarboxylate transporter substrate-binding protein [Casimicrobium sp.]HPT56372.1 tripartite tricarboxylate transporter substrate-binding protein [Casimicrobium sp.]